MGRRRLETRTDLKDMRWALPPRDAGAGAWRKHGRRASSGAGPTPAAAALPWPWSAGGGPAAEDPERTLFVSGLDPAVEEHHVWRALAPAGSIVAVRVPRRHDGRCAGLRAGGALRARFAARRPARRARGMTGRREFTAGGGGGGGRSMRIAYVVLSTAEEVTPRPLTPPSRLPSPLPLIPPPLLPRSPSSPFPLAASLIPSETTGQSMLLVLDRTRTTPS